MSNYSNSFAKRKAKARQASKVAFRVQPVRTNEMIEAGIMADVKSSKKTVRVDGYNRAISFINKGRASRNMVDFIVNVDNNKD